MPAPLYVAHLRQHSSESVRALCVLAGVPCKATGAWAERQIEITAAEKLCIVAEPGATGSVRISMKRRSARQDARTALAVLAYGLHDLVAKQSVKGQSWTRVKPPPGRPKLGRRPLSNAERQRRFRLRHRTSACERTS
ncbi:MAG: hypothetical protein H6714_00315 [Myxococcales bacterium]|nr:hypothetical protein [Myxococcales bacterium]